MPLSPGSKTSRTGEAENFIRRTFSGCDPEDIEECVMMALSKFVKPKGSVGGGETRLEASEFFNIVKKSSREGNPGAMRIMKELLDEQAGREYLSSLTINIVPYTIKDKSLPDIIAKCEEPIFVAMMAAGQKRLDQKLV